MPGSLGKGVGRGGRGHERRRSTAPLGAPAWEQWLALGLTLLCIAGLVRPAGRIYRNAVLRTGTRIKLSDTLRDA